MHLCTLEAVPSAPTSTTRTILRISLGGRDLFKAFYVHLIKNFYCGSFHVHHAQNKNPPSSIMSLEKVALTSPIFPCMPGQNYRKFRSPVSFFPSVADPPPSQMSCSPFLTSWNGAAAFWWLRHIFEIGGGWLGKTEFSIWGKADVVKAEVFVWPGPGVYAEPMD